MVYFGHCELTVLMIEVGKQINDNLTTTNTKSLWNCWIDKYDISDMYAHGHCGRDYKTVLLFQGKYSIPVYCQI